MKLVIVSGISGSGKSTAMDAFEDMGYYCIDNLPINLVTHFVELLQGSKVDYGKVALGIDVRSMLYALEKGINIESWGVLEKNVESMDILFMEASDQEIVSRYKFTRRSHPLSLGQSIVDGLGKERELLEPIRNRASYIFDTTDLTVRQLKKTLLEIYGEGNLSSHLNVLVASFGFKHGLPLDADLVFDVRFMPNPYYQPELKEKTGNDQDVVDYVMDSEISKEFVKRLEDFLLFLLPQYVAEGKSRLVIAIGCTGGRHRSVTVANRITKVLEESGYSVYQRHRDCTLK